MTTNPYNIDLDRNPANHLPLTPLTFLDRAASVFPRVRIHNQNMTTAASAHADRKTLGHLS